MAFWNKRNKTRNKPKRHSQYTVMAALLAGKDVGVVFDVGANEGRVAAKLIKTLTPKRLLAFEPIATNAQQLSANLADYPEVELHQIAVSASDGPVQININKNSIYNNSLLSAASGAEKWHDIEHVSSETVLCQRLDSFCTEHGIDKIDVLKIDAEGADFMVLQGAEQLLRSKSIGIVYVEILFRESFVGQGSFAQIINLMEGHGYVLYNLFGWKTDDNGRLFRADGLFVERGLLPQS